MMTASRRLPTRKDAVANRERLLSGAEEYFGELGLDAPLHGLAEHVGVGVGTLYRNFATHSELVRALHDRAIERFNTVAEEAAREPTAWGVLCASMYGVVDVLVEFPATGAVMRRQFENDPAHRPTLTFHHSLQVAVDQAHADGDLRPDATAVDLATIPFAVGGLMSFTKDERGPIARRQIALVLEGLRAHPHEPAELPPEARVQGTIESAGSMIVGDVEG